MNGFYNTPLSRRGAIKLGALGGITLGFGTSQEAHAAQKWYESKEGKAKSVFKLSAAVVWRPRNRSIPSPKLL